MRGITSDCRVATLSTLSSSPADNDGGNLDGADLACDILQAGRSRPCSFACGAPRRLSSMTCARSSGLSALRRQHMVDRHFDGFAA